jgi:serine/threonine-protein kinase
MQSNFGRYLILKKIAVGGMAEIFLARRMGIGHFSKFVVLKRLSPEYQGKKSFERLFVHEAKLTARLAHPNIVQLHDLGQVDGSYFMAMEYIHGVSSAEMMSKAAQKRKPVPIGVALHIVLSAARALAYCSQELSYEGEEIGILHHDVSPHNIQIRFDGQVKLLDFGVATETTQESSTGRRGKFAYMSPEAFKREELDHRSDLFSLGVVLYELTMGRRLFKGRTPQETQQRAEECSIPQPRSIHPKFPENLENLILRALAKDRDERFSTASELCVSIEEVINTLKLESSAQRVSQYLHTLYQDTIDDRQTQLQNLVVKAQMMSERGLENVATIQSDEHAPLNASGIPLSGLPSLSDLPPTGSQVHTPPPAPVNTPVFFEPERVEDELKEEIIHHLPALKESSLPQGLEGNIEGSIEGNLPANFTQIGQRESDWDEERIRHRREKKVRIFLGFFALILAGVGFFAGQSLHLLYPENNWFNLQQGTLSLQSTPTGVDVIIDGVLKGKTPLKLPLTPGPLDLILRSQSQGYEKYERIYQVKPSQNLVLDVYLKPSVP